VLTDLNQVPHWQAKEMQDYQGQAGVRLTSEGVSCFSHHTRPSRLAPIPVLPYSAKNEFTRRAAYPKSFHPETGEQGGEARHRREQGFSGKVFSHQEKRQAVRTFRASFSA